MKPAIKSICVLSAALLLLAGCQKKESSLQDRLNQAASNTSSAESSEGSGTESSQDPSTAPSSEPSSEPSDNGGKGTSSLKGGSKNGKDTGGKETGGPVEIISLASGSYFDYSLIDADTELFARIYGEYALVGDDSLEQYPQLQKSLLSLGEQRQEGRREIYEQVLSYAKEDVANGTISPDGYFVTEYFCTRRADTRVTSLLMYGEYATGGVHNYPYYAACTFDTQTGKLLELSDVVTDVSVLPELVQQQLDNTTGTEYLYENADLEYYFEEYKDSLNWTLDYYGLTIYFNPYEIAPYASGMPVAVLTFEEYPDLVREEYREVPESYCIDFPNERSFYYDLDGDGKLDDIYTSGSYEMLDNNEYYFPSQYVYINGEMLTVESTTNGIYPTLVHMADGRNYLYVGNENGIGYRWYELYDITGGTIKSLGTFYAYPPHFYESETRQLLTDPEHFTLETITYLLGSVYGTDTYHVGSDGKPVKESDWYWFDQTTKFTLLQPLTVTIVDEDGKEYGEETLQKGDTVIYYRTGYDDGTESIADLLLPDGRIGRVVVDTSNWYTIDGVMIEDIFDGLTYWD